MVDQTRNIDYCLVGHVTQDLTEQGPTLGGTVTYAGLTAHAMGRHVGILTAASDEMILKPLADLQLECRNSNKTTTFENIYRPEGRHQHIVAKATDLHIDQLPPHWSEASILHCAPVANEVDPTFIQSTSSSMLALTPQGWLRRWDDSGFVSLTNWGALGPFLHPTAIIALSLEDLGGSMEAAEEIANRCTVLAVTMGSAGAMVFAEGKNRLVPAPTVKEVDPTGCGDIFAAAFFIFLNQGDDPWTAARSANHLAAQAVTRRGLASIPTPDEIDQAKQLRAV